MENRNVGEADRSREMAERKAGEKLQLVLDENYRAIRAIRSYQQLSWNWKIHYDERDAQLKVLKNFIEEESKGLFSAEKGMLCQISDTFTVWFHPSMVGGSFPVTHKQHVRGFGFNFTFPPYKFSCVDLDDGKSRAYFDQKDPAGKRDFILRHITQSLNREEIQQGPFRCGAFISDQDGKFVIEELVSAGEIPGQQ